MLELARVNALLVPLVAGKPVGCERMKIEYCTFEVFVVDSFRCFGVEEIGGREVEGRVHCDFVSRSRASVKGTYFSIFMASSLLSYLKALHPSRNLPTIFARSL